MMMATEVYIFQEAREQEFGNVVETEGFGGEDCRFEEVSK